MERSVQHSGGENFFGVGGLDTAVTQCFCSIREKNTEYASSIGPVVSLRPRLWPPEYKTLSGTYGLPSPLTGVDVVSRGCSTVVRPRVGRTKVKGLDLLFLRIPATAAASLRRLGPDSDRLPRSHHGDRPSSSSASAEGHAAPRSPLWWPLNNRRNRRRDRCVCRSPRSSRT